MERFVETEPDALTRNSKNKTEDWFYLIFCLSAPLPGRKNQINSPDFNFQLPAYAPAVCVEVGFRVDDEAEEQTNPNPIM